MLMHSFSVISKNIAISHGSLPVGEAKLSNSERFFVCLNGSVESVTIHVQCFRFTLQRREFVIDFLLPETNVIQSLI